MERLKEFIYKNYIYFFDLYFLSIFLKSTTLVIDFPMLAIIEKIIRCIAFCFMVTRTLLVMPEVYQKVINVEWKDKSKLEKISIILFIVLIIAEIINFILYRSIRILSITLVVISAYGIPYNKIIKNTMKMQLIMTCLVILLSVLGITQNYYIPRENGTFRYSLGFSYTTNLSQIILFMSFMYFYTKNFKPDNEILIFMQVTNLLTYFITDSKTEILFFEAIVVVILLNKYCNKEIFNKAKVVYSKLMYKFFMVLPLASLVLVLLYPMGGFINKINSILSNRLLQTHEVISEGNVALFGSSVELKGYGIGDILKYGQNFKSNYIDNEYMQILVLYGIIIFFVFIAAINILLYCLNSKKRYKEIFLCTIYLFFGLMNPRIIDLMYSPILFMVIPSVIEEISKNGENFEKKCS